MFQHLKLKSNKLALTSSVGLKKELVDLKNSPVGEKCNKNYSYFETNY